MECANVDVYYGDFRAVSGVNLIFGYNEITALIGPSGCGKSTLLRSLNRMNDLIIGARVTGRGDSTTVQTSTPTASTPIEVRRRIGMVFQKPNPFPKSIYDNVAYGPRVIGMNRRNMDDLVEEALTQAALWDRGQGQAQAVRLRPLGWSTAAALHCPDHRRQARGDPDGRALLRA